MELDMTQGQPLSLITKFIIPIILGNIFQQFYSVVDTVIVGQFVGVKALAAVGATGTISFLILGFMQGLTTGFTVLTSQRFGAGDREGVKKSVGNGYVLALIITVLMTAVSVVGMHGLLGMMRTPEDIYGMSYTYIIIICWGMGFNILYNLLSSMLRSVGNSRVPLYFLILAALLNVVMDLVLIIVFHMGVAGAAVATIFSQGVSGLLCLLYIIKKVPLLCIEKRHFRLEKWCVKNQLSIGIPMALQFSITAVGTIMVQTALNMLGSTVVASYTVACKVEQFVTQVHAAMGMTMATYSAQNRGIGNLTRIRQGAKVAFWMSTVYSVVVYVLLEATLPWVVRIFLTGDLTEVLSYVRIYITICGIFFTTLGMIYIYRNVMQGCGFGFLPMMGGVVELLSRAVMALVAARLLSYAGVCWANASAWCLAGIFLWIAYKFVMKRMVQNQERELEEGALE
ncbi:MAG: MATE family efflux transporter [Eubacteriales bacterium]|nr:MATE family efflux transporter [Eubacteriales bacterium]